MVHLIYYWSFPIFSFKIFYFSDFYLKNFSFASYSMRKENWANFALATSHDILEKVKLFTGFQKQTNKQTNSGRFNLKT